MTDAMRPSTLEALGLGSVHDIVRRGKLPVEASEAVERVFGPASRRGALVISGANGIVGAGKTVQLGSRLEPHGVPLVALDFPGVADGIPRQYPGLVRAFGRERAAAIAANVIKLTYDGSRLPAQLAQLEPKFLLEAVPEVLAIKRAHYEVFRSRFPGVEIRSVTSGFPQSELGVGIAHPAFPHEINKVFEIVEPEPSDITHLLWAIGLTPVAVSDHWSFVLDVLFCGLTLAALRYHEASNVPFWKVDKHVRRLLGPNPFRAHDAIGAAGANFLTWSCLHHLGMHYGDLFRPTAALEERKDSGQDWYPPDHFRPVVNWNLEADELDELRTWILGALVQMTVLMVHEDRSTLAQMNAIGELCAQFARGPLAVIRSLGATDASHLVESYHRLHPAAADASWHPDALARLENTDWQQLYVNAEHDGRVGVISIGRESYNWDVDAELNRAIDWLRSNGIERVVVTGDFHLAGQMVGADTREFFPALADADRGVVVSQSWSATARRLHRDFTTSVGLIAGKRCLGGMLELLMHCHFLVTVEDVAIGMPEVTLPVVPGMEGCHWPFRRTTVDHWPTLLGLLLEGESVRAKDTTGWLTDYAGKLDDVLQVAWLVASGGEHGLKRRPVREDAFDMTTVDVPTLTGAASHEARRAILDTVRAACGATLDEALDVQARHSGGFMTSDACRRGVIGTAARKTMAV